MNTQPPTQQYQPSAHPDPPVQPGAPIAPPAAKRSWFARHKLLTGAIFAVGLITVGAIASSGDSDDSTGPRAAASPDDDAEATDITQATGDETDGEDGAIADAEELTGDAAPDQPGIGDVVQDGDFEFVVNDVELGVDRVGNDFLGTQAQGQFVLVHATITNIGTEEVTFFGSNQNLIDSQDRTHSADTEAAIYLEDANSFLTDVNPGNTTDVIVIFDVPADAVPAAVELHGSMFSSGVLVSVQQTD